MKNLLLLFVTFVLFTACEEQDIVANQSSRNSANLSAGDDEILETETGFENAPAQSGFIVTRQDEIFGLVFGGFLYTDEKTGLTATYAVDNEVFCAREPGAFDLIPTQLVDIPNPDNEDRLKVLQKGLVTTTVYDGLYEPPLCEFIASTPILAKGKAKMVHTDNDFFAFFRDNKNRNTATIRVFGEINKPTGEPVFYDGIYQINWDAKDFSTIRTKKKIQIR